MLLFTSGMSLRLRSMRLQHALWFDYGIIVPGRFPEYKAFETRARQLDSVGAKHAAGLVREYASYLVV